MSFPLPGFISFALKALCLSSTVDESTKEMRRSFLRIGPSINRGIEALEEPRDGQVQGCLHTCREVASNFYSGVLIQLGIIRTKVLTLDRVGFATSRTPNPHLLLLAVMSVFFVFTTASAYGKTTPTLTVATSGTPSTYGSSVTFTATITNGPTTGTITFYDGSTSIGTGSIGGTTATCNTSALAGGSHSITAKYPGNSSYNAVTSSAITQTVNKATPAINWATPAAITYGTALSTTQLNASATPAGSFAYTPASGTVLGAGSHSLSVTFTPTNTTDYNSATATVTQTVNKATPTINWATPAAITYGTTLSATQLNASTTPAGSFAYTPASGTELGAGSHSLSVTFTPTDTTDYNSATAAVTQTVNKATPAINWATPAAITYGTALSATQLNASTTPAGSFAYTPASGTVLGAGSQSLSVTFTPTDTTDYNNASATVAQTVNQATPVITWSNPAGITYGAALSGTQLNATANVPGSFSYSPASGTVLSPGTQTLSTTFTPTDTADYATATTTVSLVVSAIPGPGIITTVAGNGYWNNNGDGGLAINAAMEQPEGIAIDSVGNIYIPDVASNVVRKVSSATGIITTIAGTGTQGFSGDGGPATSAQLNAPVAVAVDAAGDVYILDGGNDRVRRLAASTGIITTVVGNGGGGVLGRRRTCNGCRDMRGRHRL